MKTKLYSRCVCFAYLAAMGMAQAQTATESVLHNFVDSPQGAGPSSSVVRDPAGNLYGTTQYGGTAGIGVVYKLSPSGHVKVLYNFTGEAQQYNTGVVRDPAGNLYGSATTTVFKLDTAGNFTVLANPELPSPVTLNGAGNLYWTGAVFCRFRYCGVIDKLDPSGNLTVLHNFSVEDASPTSGVTLDAAGNLYGTAGGVGNLIYKLDPGGHFTMLCTFPEGTEPVGGLIDDTAGNLYGAAWGGTGGAGLLYELDTAGNFSVLYTFTGGADGSSPIGLVRDSAGNLYGTTSGGGTAGYGLVFKLDTAGNFTVLYTFTGADGASPQAPVILDPAGNLDGTTSAGGSFGWGAVFRVDPAGHETVLYSFSADGGTYPTGGLIGDSAGNLYGTTADGGTFGLNCGVVYKLDGAGHFTVLYSFTGGADGWRPSAGVVRDSAGNLYGTTWNGGSAGHGVVFKLDTAGTETVLYNFTGGADGGNPVAGVVLDPAGNIYGNSGVIFKLDTAGNFTVLHTFTGGAGGSYPYAGVIRDPAGNLYGTAAWGGNLNCMVYLEQGCGLVYKLDPAGNYTVLYTFSGGSDGAIPYFAGVVRDTAGNLYGTTAYGGTKDCDGPGCGTVYKLDTSGKETVLHRFTGGDGCQPEGVNLDSAGGIYGTTPSGDFNCGVVFNIDPAGQFTVVYSFTGADPLPGLVHDPAGTLFGTLSGASSGNPWVGGGVFKLKLP